MSITVHRTNNPAHRYTMIANGFLRSDLEPMAKVVGCYLLSHSESFVMTQERIAEAVGVSRPSVAKALRVLESAGYLVAVHLRDAAGHPMGSRLHISDVPLSPEERRSLSDNSLHREPDSDDPVSKKLTDQCEESLPHKKTISKKTKEISESADSDLDLGVVPQPKPKARKTAMPPAWKPPAALFSFGDSLHLSYSDIELEADRFRDWVAANNVKYVDWTAAFRNWLRRAAEMKSRGTNRPGRFENAGRDERSGLRVER